MKIKLDFIQARMVVEKQKIVSIVIVVLALMVFMTLIAARNYAGYLFGLKDMDSKEKIDKFYNSKFYFSNLHFDEVVNTGEKIYIETSKQQQIAIIGAGGGIVGNLPETKEIDAYNVYLLKSNETIVILCSEDQNLNFLNNVIKVSNRYKNVNVNEAIINEFTEDGQAYVFYASENYGLGQKAITLIVLTYAILILTIAVIRHSKFVHKRTKLGKAISKLGDYDTIVKEINEQEKCAIYKYGNAVVVDKHILLLTNKSTEIVPIGEINNVNVIPDANYPDEIIKIEFAYNNKIYNFNVYNKDDAQKIETHIKKNSNVKNRL